MSVHVHETPRIYVACLASYNAGKLHGEWIDAVDEQEIWDGIHEMLADSPQPGAEEWAIHDHENFCGLRISEHEDIEDLARLGALIKKHGEAYAAYVGHTGGDYDDEEGFEERYRGHWDSEVEYAEQLFDELYAHDIPENIRFYIDYEKFAHDLFIGDCYSVASETGGVFVFDRC